MDRPSLRKLIRDASDIAGFKLQDLHQFADGIVHDQPGVREPNFESWSRNLRRKKSAVEVAPDLLALMNFLGSRAESSEAATSKSAEIAMEHVRGELHWFMESTGLVVAAASWLSKPPLASIWSPTASEDERKESVLQVFQRCTSGDFGLFASAYSLWIRLKESKHTRRNALYLSYRLGVSALTFALYSEAAEIAAYGVSEARKGIKSMLTTTDGAAEMRSIFLACRRLEAVAATYAEFPDVPSFAGWSAPVEDHYRADAELAPEIEGHRQRLQRDVLRLLCRCSVAFDQSIEWPKGLESIAPSAKELVESYRVSMSTVEPELLDLDTLARSTLLLLDDVQLAETQVRAAIIKYEKSIQGASDTPVYRYTAVSLAITTTLLQLKRNDIDGARKTWTYANEKLMEQKPVRHLRDYERYIDRILNGPSGKVVS